MWGVMWLGSESKRSKSVDSYTPLHSHSPGTFLSSRKLCHCFQNSSLDVWYPHKGPFAIFGVRVRDVTRTGCCWCGRAWLLTCSDPTPTNYRVSRNCHVTVIRQLIMIRGATCTFTRSRSDGDCHQDKPSPWQTSPAVCSGVPLQRAH
jgi:hypothetical protein